ncbi:hypothetical protein ACJMK2_029192 [Sinanodonta woodiana]|uniref:Uncharacterized protein n=1 Tax=Sinanodonta woodiana TaxID=1069815 RepID=A0ABD3X9W1_SINWO
MKLQSTRTSNPSATDKECKLKEVWVRQDPEEKKNKTKIWKTQDGRDKTILTSCQNPNIHNSGREYLQGGGRRDGVPMEPHSSFKTKHAPSGTTESSKTRSMQNNASNTLDAIGKKTGGHHNTAYGRKQ